MQQIDKVQFRLSLTICLLLVVGSMGTKMLRGLTGYAHTLVERLLSMHMVMSLQSLNRCPIVLPLKQQDDALVVKLTKPDCHNTSWRSE